MAVGRSSASPVATQPRGIGRRWPFFLLIWLLLAAAGAAWAVATPLFASPDEDAQVVKAVAVAQGQFTGETILQPGEYFPIMTSVQVPGYYGSARSTVLCFVWDTLQPAGCGPSFTAHGGVAAVHTWFGRYPPLYYSIVGIPSRFVGGEAAVLGMRTAGAALCAGLLALGFTALRTTRHPTALMGAALVGVTPTALFFTGMVNPTGLEIAAGFALWCLLLPLVVDPGVHRTRERLLVGAVVAVVLVNTRPGSALMAVLIGVPLALITTRPFWRDLWRSGLLRLPLAVCVLGGLAAAAWLLVEDPTATFGGDPDPALRSPVRAAVAASGMSLRYLREQVAVFGWLNFSAHPLVFVLVAGSVVALVTASLLLARGRLRWALLAAVALVLLVPVVIQVPGAERLGLIWQGRYILPVSVGVPVLAMAGLAQRVRLQRPAAVAGVLLTAAGVTAHLGAFGWACWRYAYGFGRSPLAAAPTWQPPGGLALWVALFVVSMLGVGAVCVLQRDSPIRRIASAVRRPAAAAVPAAIPSP